ncbi:hypothetical protein LCGC14_0733980, partial [marine sediment metagenome]
MSSQATKHFTVRLRDVGACSDAVKWADEQPDLATAWSQCARGDWMLWLIGRLNDDRKALVRCACACARLALPYVKAGELRPLKAIET